MNTTEPVLKKAMRACRRAFWFVTFFSCIVNILMLTVPIYMLQVMDRVFASHSLDTLFYLTLIALFALAILAIIDFVRSRMLLFISHWLDNKLSPEALLRSVDTLLKGDTYGAQSIRDIATIRGFLTGPGMTAFLDSPWVPIYLLVIFMLHPYLGLLGTLGAIILFCFAILNEKSIRSLILESNTNAMTAQHYIALTLRNAESIQAMGMLSSIINRWFLENKKVLGIQSIANKRSGLILAGSKFTRLAIQVLVLGLGAYLVVNNQLTPGGMLAASIILSRALAPIEQAIGVWNQFLGTRQAYERLDHYFNLPSHRTGEIQLPTPKGHISVENVSYIPPGLPGTQRYILKNIQFELNPGEVLAIIGPSAAGKTSLARLLVGAWGPSAGNVRLDGASIYDWDRNEIGKHIGYLPQAVELFVGSIKLNISRMQDADDADVIQAGMDAGVHDMILHFPEGYDTMLTESMHNLSAGQRQRIGFARALFGRPPYIVLDEPNSNLDAEGEQALVVALLAAKARGGTVIFIAHRLGVIKIADKILLLKEGVLQLFGPSNEVMAKMKMGS